MKKKQPKQKPKQKEVSRPDELYLCHGIVEIRKRGRKIISMKMDMYNL